MFVKHANSNFKMEVEALHVPDGNGWQFYNTSRIKVASIEKAKSIDLGGFDLTAAVKENPDNLFVKVFAIKANEVNDNGDCFNEAELKKAAHTFIGVPVFVNHQNDNIENARGKVVHAWYDEPMKGIYCINMVDRAAYPRLARGIEEKYINGCFPPDAPVLMHDGSEKPICDIEDGDLVISGKGNICKVLGKRQRGYNYPLYSINIEGIKNPLVCTAHHNIYVYRLPKECACGCGEAIGATVDKRITNQKFNRKFKQGHNPCGCKVQHEYIQKIKACEIEADDFLIEPKYLDESVHTLTEEQCFLLGLFMAKGSFEKRDGVRKSVIFNFAHTELETLASRCSDLLESVFANHRNAPTTNFYPGSSQTRVCLYGEDIADFFYKYCGEYSDQKKMHADLLKLDKEKTTALLAGYMEGDGWNVKGKVYGISTVSKNLASQLRILFAKIGVRTRFRKQEVKTGYKAKAGGGYTQAYTIEFGLTTANGLANKLLYKNAKKSKYNPASFHNLDKFVLRKIKGIHEIEYEGVVYDIEVENDHSYCVNHIMVSNTSMGAQVGYSLCSICHNKAHTADEFCTHVKSGKNRKISGKYDCKYHESGCKPDGACPLDGCKKGDKHELHHKEAKVFEWNYDIKFIEDSFVVNPACHDCLVCDILDVSKIKDKVAENIDQLKKVASSLASTVDNMNDNSLEKTAGKSELQALSQAMNLMEHVARSMMAQKQQIQLDYASDLVEHMAKVQSLLDELTEMGYGRLQSPSEQEIAIGKLLSSPVATTTPTIEPTTQQVINPQMVGQVPQAAARQLAQMPTPTGGQASSLGDIGTVTRPAYTKSSSKIEDFIKHSQNVHDKLDILSSELRKSIILLAQRSNELANSDHVSEYVAGDTKITVANIDGSGLIVGKWKNNKLVSWTSVEEFGDEIVKLAASNPHDAAKIIIEKYQSELGDNMSANNTTKVAASSSQQEVTTQGQLENNKGTYAYTGEVSVTTQGQLEGKGELKASNETTSGNLQMHKDSSPEVITQAQLAALEGDLARWDSFPEVITQGQWDEMSRRISGCCGDKFLDQITQAQLQALQKEHKWVDPHVVTQAQLNDQKKVSPEGMSASARVASTAKDLMKAASATLTDAIAHYNMSPNDIQNAMNVITASPYAQIKAAYLSLVNAQPTKIANRADERARNAYFARTASANGTKAVDNMLAAMGDNIGYNVAEDFVDALKFAASNKRVFAAAEQTAQIKMASAQSASNETLSKESMFANAFEEMNASEDGLYKICGTINDDIKVDPANQSEFMSALYAFAKTHISKPFVIANVDVDRELGVFEMDCKEHSVCSADEKTAFAQAVNSQFKTASANEVNSDVVTAENNDGMYKICGTLSEDVTVNPSDRAKFMRALYSYAKSHIDGPFVISNVDVDSDLGTFEMICKEASACSDMEKKAFVQAIKSNFKTAQSEGEFDDFIIGPQSDEFEPENDDAEYEPESDESDESNTDEGDDEDDKDVSISDEYAKAHESEFSKDDSMGESMKRESRVANRAAMRRMAQMMGGQLGGGMGGGGPAGGVGGTMPGADAGMAAGGGMPGAEALSAAPGAAAATTPAETETDSDMKPQPPGTICPVCGSRDVDVLDGKCKCNNCGAEFNIKVDIEITKYPGVLDSGEAKKEKAESGEGLEMTKGGEEMSTLPVAATTRITNNMLKVAQQTAAAQGKSWSLGGISPYTGSNSVLKLSDNRFLCLDTGNTYEVHVAGANANGQKAVFAEWRYNAVPMERSCPACSRKKIAFVKALEAHGIDEDTFDSMLLPEKGMTILAMKDKGLLKTVKTASAQDMLDGMRKTAGFGDKFPMETCMEKIARKYGENALAMSGPCAGKPLAECACKKLATAGVYANDLAIKVAGIYSVEDQMINCVEDFVRINKFSMKQACVVCEQLKNKFAATEDMIVEAMDAGTDEPTPTNYEGDDTDSMKPIKDEVEAPVDENIDPFADATVSVELPKDLLEKLDAVLDKALGEEPAAEEHHKEKVHVEPAVEKSEALDVAVKETEMVPAGTDVVAPNTEIKQSSEEESEDESKENSKDESEDEAHEEQEIKDEDKDEDYEKSKDDSETAVDEKEEDAQEENAKEEDDKEDHAHNKDHEHKDDTVKPEHLQKTGDPKVDTEASSDADIFRKGRISATGKINLNLDAVLAALNGKQTKVADKVNIVNNHKDKDLGKIQDGKPMGHESKFDAKAPEVPEGGKKALMGGEADAKLDVVTNTPEFDAGGGEMGHEKELGYTSEKTHDATGGDKGQGNHKASSKARTTVLAERIMNSMKKTASDKKVDEAKPVVETADVGTVAKEDMYTGDVGTTDDNQLLGHEKDTVKDIPKAGKDAPSIPVGGGMNPKFDKNEKNKPELQTAVKGTVIAGSDAETVAIRKEAATKIAGRKLKAGLITLDKLASEIEKLARYELSDLQDIEAALFGASKKGLDTVAKGVEKPLVISERSNQRMVAQELRDSIQSLFTLNRSNMLAQDDPNVELRNLNKRFDR